MSHIKTFDSFVKSINENYVGKKVATDYATGDKSKLVAKAKRIVTGTHVGFDPKEGAKYPLTALGQKNFDSIVAAWKKGDKDQAAELLRSVIIKERDSQFKFGVAAIMSGIAISKFGIDRLEELVKEPLTNTTPPTTPPVTPPTEGGTEYVVKQGDNVWNIGKSHLPKGSSDSTILDYMYKIVGSNKGMDADQINALIQSGSKPWEDPDFIKAGMKLILPKP
jgi:nucleoid-associated protein YgaU